MPEEFIGRGWKFPLGTDNTGGIALVSEDADIARAIRLILSTAPGERPMRPNFGCGIYDYVFAPANLSTAGALAIEVEKAVKFWEPRVSVKSVDVSIDDYQRNTLYISIVYEKKGSYDPRNLVFPFYVIPEQE